MRGAADMDPSEELAPKRAAEPRPRRRYRDLIETADGILWESDPTGSQYTFVSPRAEELLGYAVSRWLSEPDFWLTLVDADDRARASSLRSAILAGNGGTLEYRARSSDGAKIWIRETVRIARDRSGRPFAARGMMVDVTDLKQAEEVALRLSSILEQSRTAKVVPLDVRRSERQPKTAAPPDARTLFLAEIARLAPTQREPRALASAMLRQLAPQYELDLAVLALERFAGSEIVATLPEADAPRPHADCDLVARLEEAEDITVVPTAATRCPEVTRDMSSLQILPLHGQDGRRVGALAVATRRAESFDDEDRAELRWYADQMGRWLAFAGAYETLSATSTLDPLTGLLTRDAFYLRFAQEVSRATRSDQRLALLRWSLWDAPDDARITEVAARAFGEVLKAELRPYDVVARLGAREFVALVFVRNHEVAHNIAGRVQQHAVRTSIGRGRFLEVPARGFALFPDDANQLDGLDRIAEVRLANHRETRRSLIGGRSNGRGEPQAAG